MGGGQAESLPAEAGPVDSGAAAEPAPTMEALMAAPEAPMPEAPAGDEFAKTAPPAEAPAADLQRGTAPIVPALWIMVLAVAGVVLIGLSVYIDRLTRRNFRSRVEEK